MDGRVEADENHLGVCRAITRYVSGHRRSLQMHIPKIPPKNRQTRKPESPPFEILLLQVLVWNSRFVVGVSRDVHFPLLANDPAVLVHEDRRVETALSRIFHCDFRIPF